MPHYIYNEMISPILSLLDLRDGRGPIDLATAYLRVTQTTAAVIRGTDVDVHTSA